jgi:ABC-type branched-subunit amino acid transport system ATPase component
MSGPALQLKDVRKSFGKTEIIRGVSLSVQPGERVGIIGPNGAGKSTLFNLISGRFAPTSGEILLNGQRIDGLKPYEINRQGPVAQLPDHQHLPQAVGVREPALRRAVEPGLQATPSCAFWPPRRRQPARRAADGAFTWDASATRWP